MSVEHLDVLREQLKELRCQHRQLDTDIEQLERGLYVDSLQIRRMKKQKLVLKEAIVRLENQLIPDLNA